MGEDHHSNLTTNDLVNVLCMKWGNKYPADYVNRLYSMVARNMQRPFRFICLTEDSVGRTRWDGDTLCVHCAEILYLSANSRALGFHSGLSLLFSLLRCYFYLAHSRHSLPYLFGVAHHPAS